MLAGLLPGLRQVRTPLAVGYMWLLVLWLLFADDLPRNPTDGSLISRVFELGGFFGKAAVVATLSFVAYLIGSLIPINPHRVLSFRLRFVILARGGATLPES